MSTPWEQRQHRLALLHFFGCIPWLALAFVHQAFLLGFAVWLVGGFMVRDPLICTRCGKSALDRPWSIEGRTRALRMWLDLSAPLHCPHCGERLRAAER